MDELLAAPTAEPLQAPLDATVARRGARRAIGAGVLGVAVGIAAAACFAVAFLAGLGYVYDGRVLPGVRVGGVSLAGLDRSAAVARLEAALPAPAAGNLVLNVGDERLTVPLRTLGRRYDLERAVDDALAYGRSGTLLDRAAAEARGLLSGADGGSPVTYDEAALSSYLFESAFAAARVPRDSEVDWVSGTPWFVVTPDQAGRHLDLAATRASLDAGLRGAAGGDVVVEATVVTVSPTVSYATAHATMDAAVQLASRPLTLRYGARSWTIPRGTVAGWLAFGPDGTAPYGVRPEPARITASLAAIAKQVAKPAKNAVFVTKGGKIVGVIASSTGASLDTAASAARIAAATLAVPSGGTVGPVQLAVTSVVPALDSSSAAAYLPRMVLLGSWTTPYVPSDHNFFGKNITIPTNIINGYVVMPGQLFDFFKVVTISRAVGFGPGGFIRNGHTDPTGALGGGICSCSTTLFNAALRSGLQMGARANHYYYITRYPVGLDATVWIEGGSRQTMSFRNDTAYPIVIRGLNAYGKVTFQIYGVRDGRRVVLSAPTIKNYVSAGDDVAYTSALRKGVRERVEYPASGFDAWVTRTVYAADGHILHRETYFSHYARVNGLTLIGTG
jgi:vancomycin resistance protein YoaR